jgi:hypothetical protein
VSSEVANGLEDSAEHGECLSAPAGAVGYAGILTSRACAVNQVRQEIFEKYSGRGGGVLSEQLQGTGPIWKDPGLASLPGRDNIHPSNNADPPLPPY